MADPRLDAELAARGLARSRTHAAQLVTAGLVSVDGRPQTKPSARVAAHQRLEVAQADHYVSRAAHKLIAALDEFSIDPAGVVALDLGASTGGFTQVLLERGARRVLAVDVGHDQLDPSLRTDTRVVAVDGLNVRYLTREQLRELAGDDLPSLVVGDLSFISLGLVLPAIVEAVGPDADLVLLVKPQFEVGRAGIREGIVRSAGLRDEAVMGVLWAAWDLGLRTAGVVSSPIAGSHGNREYLVWLSATRGTNPSEWSAAVSALA